MGGSGNWSIVEHENIACMELSVVDITTVISVNITEEN